MLLKIIGGFCDWCHFNPQDYLFMQIVNKNTPKLITKIPLDRWILNIYHIQGCYLKQSCWIRVYRFIDFLKNSRQIWFGIDFYPPLVKAKNEKRLKQKRCTKRRLNFLNFCHLWKNKFGWVKNAKKVKRCNFDIDLAFTEGGKSTIPIQVIFEEYIFNPCLFLVENFITHLLNKIFTPGKMYIIPKASITRANNLLIYF